MMDEHQHSNNETKHVHKHSHNHSHDVSHIKGGKLVMVVLLNLLITITEVAGGLYSGSLALISDAMHNFSDGVSIVISYIAIRVARKDNDIKKTFGYKRATILAALVNSTVLIVISLFLFKEAYSKLFITHAINGGIVIWVALVGLIANVVGVFLLQQASHSDMNMKSSYLHLLSDALSSLGVVISGIIIYYFKIYWVDSLLTAIIGIYVFKESYEIIKKGINILMQAAPDNLCVESIVNVLQQIENVEQIHHVHLWRLDENNIHFEAHVNIKNMLISDTRDILAKIKHKLAHYGVNHATIQFGYNCCEDTGIIKKRNAPDVLNCQPVEAFIL